MPAMICYPRVLSQMTQEGLRCVYFNSGAFAFDESVDVKIVGWIGPADATIRSEVRDVARHVAPPYEATLADLARRAWQEHLPGVVWILPRSHWAHELQHGSGQWMAELLREIGIDASALRDRADAAAIELQPHEGEIFTRVVMSLLQNLRGSDFTLAFPARPVLCTIHHHKQLWWQTSDGRLAEMLKSLVKNPNHETQMTKE